MIYLFEIYNKLVNTGERLKPFQTIGSEFLYNGKRSILADPVGSGKTIQSLMAAERLLKYDDYKRVFVIVPASLKYKWHSATGRLTFGLQKKLSAPILPL